MYPFNMLNIDVLAPMPSPSVMMAMRVKPGVRRSDLMAKRMSPRMGRPTAQPPIRCPVDPREDLIMTSSSADRLADSVPGPATGTIAAQAPHDRSHLSAPGTQRPRIGT